MPPKQPRQPKTNQSKPTSPKPKNRKRKAQSDTESELDANPEPNPKPKRNQRYHPPFPHSYLCNLCLKPFSTDSSLKRHFETTCSPAHNNPPGAKWHDHPSALPPTLALTLPHARPFNPTFTLPHHSHTLTWPSLSGWPTSPRELERKNAAHRSLPGSNPWYVDTCENVYADVGGEEELVAGEDPGGQLGGVWMCVNGGSVRHLLGVVESGYWQGGFADDVLLALALHIPDAKLAELLDLNALAIAQWIQQASRNFFDVHGKVHSGPSDGKGMNVVEQTRVWDGLVRGCREGHERVGCEGCAGIEGVLEGFLEGNEREEVGGGELEEEVEEGEGMEKEGWT